MKDLRSAHPPAPRTRAHIPFRERGPAMPLTMLRNTRVLVFLTLYIAAALVNIFSEASGFTGAAFVTVFLAMPLLAGVLLAGRIDHDRLTALVAVALAFSWLGDWLGDLLEPHVLFKIIFFFIGHVFYIMAFLRYRRSSLLHRPAALVGYLVVIAALLAWVAPPAGLLAPLIVVYGALLATMAVLATGLNWLAGLGSAIFVVSDLSIAVTTFALPGRIEQAELLIMSTYLVAQLMIVLGVLQRQRDDRQDATRAS